jgi:hypothetical protein
MLIMKNKAELQNIQTSLELSSFPKDKFNNDQYIVCTDNQRL